MSRRPPSLRHITSTSRNHQPPLQAEAAAAPAQAAHVPLAVAQQAEVDRVASHKRDPKTVRSYERCKALMIAFFVGTINLVKANFLHPIPYKYCKVYTKDKKECFHPPVDSQHFNFAGFNDQHVKSYMACEYASRVVPPSLLSSFARALAPPLSPWIPISALLPRSNEPALTQCSLKQRSSSSGPALTCGRLRCRSLSSQNHENQKGEGERRLD